MLSTLSNCPRNTVIASVNEMPISYKEIVRQWRVEISGRIRVFCWVRPVLSTNRRKLHQLFSTELDKIMVKIPGASKEFGFDKVFHHESNQGQLFPS